MLRTRVLLLGAAGTNAAAEFALKTSGATVLSWKLYPTGFRFAKKGQKGRH